MKFTLAVILACVSTSCWFFFCVDARYIKRSAEVSICSRSTACGWEIYQPGTRTSDFFVNSPCECENGTRCIRWSDDISIAAYVYRCRPDDEEGHSWGD